MTTYTPALRDEFRIGPISARTIIIGILGSLVVIGASSGVARLFLGLGATTSLTDGYPWGICSGVDFPLIPFTLSRMGTAVTARWCRCFSITPRINRSSSGTSIAARTYPLSLQSRTDRSR